MGCSVGWLGILLLSPLWLLYVAFWLTACLAIALWMLAKSIWPLVVILLDLVKLLGALLYAAVLYGYAGLLTVVLALKPRVMSAARRMGARP